VGGIALGAKRRKEEMLTTHGKGRGKEQTLDLGTDAARRERRKARGKKPSGGSRRGEFRGKRGGFIAG